MISGHGIFIFLGYGNIVPSTDGGKLFCIIYALFGIPLVITLLVEIGTIFRLLTLKHLIFIVEKLNLERKCNIKKRMIGTLMMLIAGFFLFIVAPSILYMHIEGWEYMDAVYYSFVTLSTIGFGDFVAGNQWDSKRIPLYTAPAAPHAGDHHKRVLYQSIRVSTEPQG